LIVGLFCAVAFNDTMLISFSSGYELSFQPQVGWVLFAVLIFLLLVVSFALAVVTVPKLKIVTDDETDLGKYKGHYGVRVKNLSWFKTIKRCILRREKLDPNPSRDVAVDLHRSGNEMRGPVVGCDISPQAEELFDVLRVDPDTGEWVLPGAVQGTDVTVKPGKHRLTLTATGEDTHPVSCTFIIDRDEKGQVVFGPEVKRSRNSINRIEI
jgi:hypothetical protein